jgi:Bacterial SH3 domain
MAIGLSVCSRFGSTILALGLLALLASQPVAAADIAIAGDTILFSGEIKAGDLSDLAKQVFKEQAARPRGLTLSLNSNGNNFEEAILLSLFVQRSGIRTMVKSGNRCNSACALIFLAGTSIEGGEAGTHKDINIEVGAELGFHMPYVSAGQSSNNAAGEALSETEAVLQLTKLFDALEVPAAIRPLLMHSDAQHSLYDATTVEAVELLEVNVEGLSVVPQKITRSMAMNSCINGYRLAKRQLPSLTETPDQANLNRSLGISPISVPAEAEGEFLLMQSDFAGDGKMLVCRVGTGGECEGFFEQSALDSQTLGQEQISDLNTCQRESNVPVLVPATTRLSEIENRIRQMETTEAAILSPKPFQSRVGKSAEAVPGFEEDAVNEEGVVSEENAQPIPQVSDVAEPPVVTSANAPYITVSVPHRQEVICNANQSFANVRLGPNGSQYPITFTLPNQTSVTVTGNTKNPVTNHPWYEISFATGSGFIDTELVQRTCLVAMAPLVSAQAAVRSAVVCNRKPGGDSANIRSAPNPLASSILRKIFNNEPLTIIGEENNPVSGQLYFKVEAQGVTGFVDNELVSKSCDVAVKPVQSPGRTLICNPGSAFTNMRLGPNKDKFDIVSQLTNGTAIRVLESTTNPDSNHPWLKIEASGEVGFVDADYVKDGC